MFQIALILLCTAQIIHFSRYWFALSKELYGDYNDRRLKNHLSWTRGQKDAVFGDTRPGSAMRRAA